MEETQHIEKKSLRIVTGNSADWNELAKDCICFANARGGVIYIGIEDNDNEAPAGQKIDNTLPAKIRKRISELTVNVATHGEIITGERKATRYFINKLA